MRAAYFTRVGPAREVLEVGDIPEPVPAEGQVRVPGVLRPYLGDRELL